MLARLSLRNAKRQIRNYQIYFVTVAITVALLFAVSNLMYSKEFQKLAMLTPDAKNLITLATVFVVLISIVVLSYASAFMLKLRKKEFGLYLTLGMTKRNIQMIFTCETGIMSSVATVLGMGAGFLLYQLLMSLFSKLMNQDITFSKYSWDGIIVTVAVSFVIFTMSSIASIFYLRRISIRQLLQEETKKSIVKHPLIWSVVSILLLVVNVVSFYQTYHTMIEAVETLSNTGFIQWFGVDIIAFFFLHLSLSKTLTGFLLKSRYLRSHQTSVVILRGLSQKMNVNSILSGALALLFALSIIAANVSFTMKSVSDKTLDNDYPFDFAAYYPAGISEETKVKDQQVLQSYSAFTNEFDFTLKTDGGCNLVNQIQGYDVMGWNDIFMSLSDFNQLLERSGQETKQLSNQYLVISNHRDILLDVSYRNVVWKHKDKEYTCAGQYIDFSAFTEDEFYFVIPDEAIEGMKIDTKCAVYTLQQKEFDAYELQEQLLSAASERRKNQYKIKQLGRVETNAVSGILIISMLYLSTVFLCLALVILSLKTLSDLEDERSRYSILFRLGVDTVLQRKTLFCQISFFFSFPFVLPFLLSIPTAITCNRLYSIFHIYHMTKAGICTSAIIALTTLAIYLLYFIITYRMASDHIICYGRQRK